MEINMRMIGKIWSKLRRNNDNRGMSLVEILCAVAIFSVVAATVSGIVIVSSRLYNKGVTQTSLQQEAQYIANQVGYIIKGANQIDANSSMGGYSGIKVVTSENGGSFIGFQDNKLYYALYEEDSAGNITNLSSFEPIAEHVESFTMTQFPESSSIELNITLNNGKEKYQMDYNMTTRNEVVQNINFSNIPTVGIDCENSIILVPGETYNLSVSTFGDTGGIDVDTGSLSGVTVKDNSGNSVTSAHYPQSGTINIPVTIDKSVTDSSKTIIIKTTRTAGDGTTPIKTLLVKFNIRRVNAVSVTHDVDWKNTANNTYEAAGSVFTFYANVQSYNAQQKAETWDAGWKQPAAVEWSSELKLGSTVTPVSDYFEEVDRVESSDTEMPHIKYRLKKDMPANLVFSVKAVSRHRRGENKNNQSYFDTSGNDEDIYGIDIVKPRDTKLNGTYYMALEPNEDGTVSIDDISVLGGIPELACTINGAVDSTTTAEVVDDNIKIHLGNDEYGSKMFYKNKDGGSSQGEGIIKIYIHPKDAMSDDITDKGAVLYVFVRRVTELTLNYKIMDNPTDSNPNPVTEPLKKDVVYQFRTNVRGTNLEYLWFEEGKPQVDADKSDKLNDADYCKRFAVEFKWEVIANNDESNPLMKGKTFWNSKSQDNKSIPVYSDPKFCVGDFGTENYGSDGKNPNFRVQFLALANKNGPNLNVKLLTDFPKNTEFRVTATALHTKGNYSFTDTDNTTVIRDVGSTNKAGIKYHDDYSETVSLNNVIEFNGSYPVADPTQGTPETDVAGNPVLDSSGKAVYSTKHVMRVPITVLSPIGDIKAYTSDSTSTDVLKVLRVENCNWNDVQPNDKGVKKGTGYVYLEVGKDAVEDEEYGIEVYAMAVKDHIIDPDTGRPKTWLAKIEVPIHIRRVTEVAVDLEKTSVNMANSKMEFTATAGGRNGQYFGIQTDENGNVCLWDEPGANGTDYVGYMTPYAWKWSMSFDDGKSWHTFVENEKGKLVVDPADTKLTEYVKESDSSGLVYDDKLTSIVTRRQETLTITLKKKLPVGTVIRATSLHAAGENRGGKEYADVFGEWVIEDIVDPDDPFDDKDVDYLQGFRRGEDYTFSYEDSKEIQNLSTAASNSNNTIDYNKGHWYWRFREITGQSSNGELTYGEWTQYYKMVNNSPSVKKINGEGREATVLLPDKRYQIELALMVLDNGKLMWPKDKSLLNTEGNGFEDYTQGWSDSDKETPKDDYRSRYNIPRACITYSNPSDYNGSLYNYTVNNEGKCVGSMSDPVVVSADSSKQLKVNLEENGYAIKSTYFQGSIDVRIQEYTESGWQLVSDSIKNNLDMQQHSQFVLIKNFSDLNKGSIYRLSFEADSNDRWCTVSGTLMNPVYNNIGKGQKYLLCGSNGTAGYIYFTVK